MKQQNNYDVVVIGAGPAGSSAAYHLARFGHRVLLLEREDFPRDKACGDGLTRRSVELLGKMGLDEKLIGFKKIKGLRVIIENNGCRDSVYKSYSSGQPDHGLVVPRSKLDQMICQRAVQAGAILWESTKATDVVVRSNGRISGVKILRNSLEEEVRATFLVAACGSNSAFAKKVGSRHCDRWSTGLALRGYYRDVRGLGDFFRVYVPLTAPDKNRPVAGYGWVFPMNDLQANIGVGFFPSQLNDLDLNLRVLFDLFIDKLKHEDQRLSHMQLIGRLRGGLLPCGFNTAYCTGKGIVLVGDSAGLVDPFTGEGISTALESGKLAAQVLNSALTSSDPQTADLSEYQRLLEVHFKERFQVGRHLIKNYGFIWKLLAKSYDIERPLFISLRKALIEKDPDEAGINKDDPISNLCIQDPSVLDDMKKIRGCISRMKESKLPLLSKTYTYLLNQHTPFIRSLCLTLSGRFGDLRNPAAIPVAASLEIANLAFLIHSDLLEHSTDRERGVPYWISADPGANFDNIYTLMAGDYLLVKSYLLISKMDPKIIQAFSLASFDVCVGNIWEEQNARHLDQSKEQYLKIAEKKTATFFELACRLGARINGASKEITGMLAEYGRNLGIALHLSNDVRDILMDSQNLLTHPIARNLEDGILSLPMILSLQGKDANNLKGLLFDREIKAEQIRNILAILRTNGSLSKVMELAQSYIDQAIQNLESLPPLAAKSTLKDIVRFVVNPVPDLSQQVPTESCSL